LNSKQDVFSARLAAEQQAKVDELSGQLAEIHNSKAWKFLMTLRKLRISLFPSGSIQEKFSQFLWKPIPGYFRKKGNKR
jgi:hypothetical protein